MSRQLFRIVSDIHQDVNCSYAPFELKRMDREYDQTLLIAGDVAPLAFDYHWQVIHELADRFQEVVIIPGNHEYYGTTFPTPQEYALRTIFDLPSNVEFHLYPGLRKMDDVALAMSSLWTDLNGGKESTIFYVTRGMNDFCAIKSCETGNDISPIDWLKAHFDHRHSMRVSADLCRGFGTKIAMTHHAPTYQSVHLKYAGNYLNPAFCANADELLEQYDVWIHGHTHASMDYISAEGCRVICNPYGYKGENQNFDHYKILEA